MRKTDMKLCNELGMKRFELFDYVIEAGDTQLCFVGDGRFCDESSLRFLRTVQQYPEQWEQQLAYYQGQGQRDPKIWNRIQMLLQLIDGERTEL